MDGYIDIDRRCFLRKRLKIKASMSLRKKIILIAFTVPLFVFLTSFFTARSVAFDLIEPAGKNLEYSHYYLFHTTLPNHLKKSSGYCFKFAPPGVDANFHGVEVYISVLGQVLSTNPIDLEEVLKLDVLIDKDYTLKQSLRSESQ